eukprot:TRINITY_DN4456_c0_g1_i1.p1 TRINITY_DN4456_c0_g1~~TRINITY_DN4456_c0_g1_i1.p1  ORF type:complete len:146 (+),score=40.17 TRINITY_DN4456_c0_g1_i1:47-439(+)
MKQFVFFVLLVAVCFAKRQGYEKITQLSEDYVGQKVELKVVHTDKIMQIPETAPLFHHQVDGFEVSGSDGADITLYIPDKIFPDFPQDKAIVYGELEQVALRGAPHTKNSYKNYALRVDSFKPVTERKRR